MNRKFLLSLLILLTFPGISGVSAPSASGPGGAVKKKAPSYLFVEHLSEAEAVLLYENKEGVIGNWLGKSFSFPGVKIESPVKEASVVINEVTHKGIRVVPAPKAITQLKFKNVPPGSRLLLYYGGSKESFVKNTAYFYLQIWVGNHLLKKNRISVDDGWKKDVLDLGVVSFLNSDVTVSYLISSDEPSGVRFTIIPELIV